MNTELLRHLPIRRLQTINRKHSFTIAISLTLLVFGLAAGIPLAGSIRLMLISLLLALSGYSFIRLFLPQLNQVLVSALGLVMSIPIWTVIDQALRTTPLRWASLLFVGALGFATHLVRRRGTSPKVPLDGSFVSVDAVGSGIVGLLSMLLLAQVWTWMQLPSLVAILVLSFALLRHRGNDALRLTSTYWAPALLLISLATVFAITRRPDDWWLPGYGLDELEYLAHAAYWWGPNMDVLLAGVPLSYQWLNFASLGLFEHVSRVDDFIISTRFDFISSALLVALLVWGFAIERLGMTRKALGSALVAALVSTTMVYPNGYNLFSFNNRSFGAAYLVALPMLTLAWQQSGFSWRAIVPLIVAANAMVGVKTAVAIPIVAILATAGAAIVLRRQWGILIKVATLGSTLLMNLLLSIKTTSGMTFNFRRPATFAAHFLGFERWQLGTNQLSRSSLPVLGVSISLLLAMTALVVVAALRWIQFPPTRVLGAAALTGIGVGYFFAMFADRVSLTHLHFIQVIVVALIPALTIDMFDKFNESLWRKNKALIVGLTAFGILAAVTAPLVADPRSSVAFLPQLLVMNYDSALAVGGAITSCVVLVVAVAVGSLRFFRWHEFRRLDIMLLALLAFSVGTGATNLVSLGASPLLRSGVQAGQLGSDDLRSAAKWIADNTTITDIVASNMFFSDPLLGDTCAFSTDEQAGWLTETAEKQNYFTPAVLAKRRFVIAAPNYGSIVSGQDPEQRVRASLLYACEPTDENRKALAEFGAQWFLAYLPTTPPRFHSPDEVVFEKGPFTVVKLGPSP